MSRYNSQRSSAEYDPPLPEISEKAQENAEDKRKRRKRRWRCLGLCNATPLTLTMKKLGFGRKKESSQDDNPYAQQPAEDQYAYKPSGRFNGLPSGPRAGGVGLPGGPAPQDGYGTPPPPYSGSTTNTGYGSDRFGAPGGYGGNRYAAQNAAAFQANQSRTQSFGSQSNSSATSRPSVQSGYQDGGPMSSQSSVQSARGPGGYGGMGRVDESNMAENRNMLFAGASQQPSSKQAPRSYEPAPGNYSTQPGASGSNQSFGDYGAQRELTDEELEQQQLRSMQDEINETRDASLASTEASLRYLDQAIETGQATLARLGTQHDRLHGVQNNLSKATIQNEHAYDRTNELKAANRSMFAFRNPLQSSKRAQAYEDKAVEQNQQERELRESIRRDQLADSRNFNQDLRGFDDSGRSQLLGASKLSAEHESKFLFEADDDEEGNALNRQKEVGIDSNIKTMGKRLEVLNGLSHAQFHELDRQNATIDKITAMSDVVDDGIRRNRARLEKIEKKR